MNNAYAVMLEHILQELLRLHNEDRLEIFEQFCGCCGQYIKISPCNCWNQK